VLAATEGQGKECPTLRIASKLERRDLKALCCRSQGLDDTLQYQYQLVFDDKSVLIRRWFRALVGERFYSLRLFKRRR